MKKIAIEEHVNMPQFSAIEREINEQLNFPNLFDPERFEKVLAPVINLPPEQHRIPLMDQHDVEIQVLSTGSHAIQLHEDPSTAVKLAREANDILSAIIQAFPDRFLGFATLPMQDPQAAVEELERCVIDLGFVGILLNGPTNFVYYDDLRFDPVWAKLAELDVPLFIHAANPSADQIKIYEGYPELLGNTWDWGYHTATHALRIMFGGVFDRHPNAKLILGHMGEGLPYLLGRLDEGYAGRNVRKKGLMANPPSYYLKKNIYIATSGGYNPETMMCAIDAVGIEHILFANDYPHYPLDQSIEQVEACPLTKQQREIIYYRNAARMFKL